MTTIGYASNRFMIGLCFHGTDGFRRAISTKNSAARYQYIGSRRKESGGIVYAHTSIYLDECAQTTLSDLLFDKANLIQTLRDEFLTTKTRED